MKKRLGWHAGWIAGFIAAAYLFTGRYNDYARERNDYLDETKYPT